MEEELLELVVILHCILVVCFQLRSPALEGGSLGLHC